MASSSTLLDRKKIEELLALKEIFMFDCDGVLWRQNNVYPQVPELIKYLRNLGKKIFFISNNNTKSRRNYLEKFSRLGIEAKEDEIYSSAYVASYYIKHVAKMEGKVYVIGTPGLVEELDKENIQHIGSGPDEVGFGDWDKTKDIQLDSEVVCVLHGFDPYYNYSKIRKAVNYLAKDTVLFIATNKDMRFPASDFIAPGTGSLVTATEISAERKATVVGKPETLIMDCIARQHNIDPQKACVIGDNIHTDIEFGNRCNTSTILVLTGVSTLADVEAQQQLSDGQERSKKIPDYYIDGLLDLSCSSDSFCSYKDDSGYKYLLQGYLCNVMADIGQGYKKLRNGDMFVSLLEWKFLKQWKDEVLYNPFLCMVKRDITMQYSYLSFVTEKNLEHIEKTV